MRSTFATVAVAAAVSIDTPRGAIANARCSTPASRTAVRLVTWVMPAGFSDTNATLWRHSL
jgi:hypothetical protein